ncbi:MAG: RNA polymerase sigma factor [Planctomycetota bacterium]
MEHAASLPASPSVAPALPEAVSPADELMAHVPDLRRWALTRCGDFHLAEDVAHEAALTALVRIDQLKDPMRLRPWMFTIARRRLADSRRRSRFESPLVGEPPACVEATDRGEAAAVKVAAMLARLPEFLSAPVVKHYLEGKPLRVVARELDSSINSIKSRLYRARRIMRARELL